VQEVRVTLSTLLIS